MTIEGSAAHYVAALAAAVERFEEADSRFAEAAAAEERVGAVTCLARTHLNWARMLLTRADHDDVKRARALLGQAITTACRVGLPTVERRATKLLAS